MVDGRDRVLRCPCGAEGRGRAGFVGDLAEQSGMNPVFMADGEIVWLCPACYQRALALAADLIVLTRNDYVVPPMLRGRS